MKDCSYSQPVKEVQCYTQMASEQPTFFEAAYAGLYDKVVAMIKDKHHLVLAKDEDERS